MDWTPVLRVRKTIRRYGYASCEHSLTSIASIPIVAWIWMKTFLAFWLAIPQQRSGRLSQRGCVRLLLPSSRPRRLDGAVGLPAWNMRHWLRRWQRWLNHDRNKLG